MSTIHAIFNPQQQVEKETVEQMLAASEYWQPDATSAAASQQQHCHMAKASLFNTERSKQDDVYHDQESGLMISANARLDNRPDLAAKLGLSPDQLNECTDSQLILKTYQQWGEDCPKYLLGDFVFIIWDEARQQLFCARDHFGVKMLYYSHTNQAAMVSNEHNAFFTANWLTKQIKEQWLIRQLWGNGPEPVQSPYHGIEILPPAHSMTVDKKGNLSISRYWTLEDKNDWQDMDDEALIEELKIRFQHAVKTRLDSAYPLAAELSEGLDSNGIAGFAAQMLGEQPIHTFSYQCKKLNDDNRSVWENTYQDIFDMLEMHDNLKPVWATDSNEGEEDQNQADNDRHSGGLLNLMGGRPDYCRMANKLGVRVILSGWGGDHCVSGYGDFYADELFSQRKWTKISQLYQQQAERGRCGTPPRAWMNLLLKKSAPRLFRWKLRNRGGLEHAMWERAEHSALKPAYIERYQLKKSLQQFTDSYRCKSVKAYHRRELFEAGVEGRLAGTEQVARMFRIEYRFPMLDVPLVELAYNIPSHLKIFNGIERYMFRRVLEGVTTERIQWRVKADVNHPQFERNQKLHAEQLGQQLLDSKLAEKYLDQPRLEQVMQHESAFQLLKNFRLILDIEKQLLQGDVKIVE